MAASATNKTMFNYFTKLPSKDCIIEENPRKTAPIFNKQHVDEFQNKLDLFDSQLLNYSHINFNYLSEFQSGAHKPFNLRRNFRGPMRARLLQFHEDVRPPYFGTWQKTSRLVTGRRPYGRDEEIFDYDVDSEAEWDIGGPGESLKDDDSEEEEENDDYEVDMKVFVPHGYVSEDEADNEAEKDNEDNDKGGVAKMYSNHSKPILVGLTFVGDNNPSVSERGAAILKAFEGQTC